MDNKKTTKKSITTKASIITTATSTKTIKTKILTKKSTTSTSATKTISTYAEIWMHGVVEAMNEGWLLLVHQTHLPALPHQV